MAKLQVEHDDSVSESKLPRRDWIVLPLLSILTIVVLITFLEGLSRRLLPEAGSLFVGACMVIHDPWVGLQAIPNSVCQEKAAEGRWTEYRFNRCGHRAGMECGPAPAGAYRIVMTGSSYGFGYMVPREKSFAALLPVELSERTGSRIELYNTSMAGEFPYAAARRFHEVIAEKPDMIIWELAPADIESSEPQAIPKEADRPGQTTGNKRSLVFDGTSKLQKHAMGWHDHIELMLRHFLYASETQDQYVASYLRNGDESSGFLKADLSPLWQERLGKLNSYAEVMQAQANAAHIPFVTVLLPNRAQAAMISMNRWPPDYNPYELDDKLRAIIVSHGGIYLDVLPDFRTISTPEQYYFAVDGHPTAEGHAIIASLLAKALTSGGIPRFGGATQAKAVIEGAR